MLLLSGMTKKKIAWTLIGQMFGLPIEIFDLDLQLLNM